MYPDLWRAWPLICLFGCHRSYPLDEVPIVGASEEALRVVEDELDFFREAVSPNEVELSKISFELMKGSRQDLWGQYRERQYRIDIDETLPVEDIPWVLRHELCHALSYQAQLVESSHNALDAYADRLYDPNLGGTEWQNDARTRRSEALARICEVGPTIAAAVAEPCSDELPLLASLGAFALEEIWLGVPAPSRLPLPVEPFATFVAREPFDRFALTPTDDPDVVELETVREESDGDWSTFEKLDVHSGVKLSPVPDARRQDSVVAMQAPGKPLEKVYFVRAAGWQDHGLAVGFFDLEAFSFETEDAPQDRLMWSGSEGWSPVPICLGSRWNGDNQPIRWDIFTAGDDAYYAQSDGQQISWSPVREQ